MISRHSQSNLRCVLRLSAGAGLLLLTPAAQAQTPSSYEVDQGEIRAPLAAAGDPARGRAIVLSRESGNCFLCHTFPNAESAPPGNLGPPLAGVGARLSTGQLRLRVVDSGRINAQSIMPAYYRVEGLTQVAANFRGKPLLNAQQVEDVVAYLAQLK
jgi:sulfur-oxidizing protein SoxX